MSKLHGVDSFHLLWARRSTFQISPELKIELLSLPDLVQAKKTQRDKDWPMIRRLVDVDYLSNRKAASSTQVSFWMNELRTPSLLIECAARWPETATQTLNTRAAVIGAAQRGDETAVERALSVEQERIRLEDKAYWAPLIKELESLRKSVRS